ncbi:MAG: hypothetical protein LCI00_14910 [Chloroflexi bacterium]|nr:hypothetical protein [Chloroflexota bacterium]MCC6892587.1 hypothetical protein [Anaerolineae bacterium]
MKKPDKPEAPKPITYAVAVPPPLPNYTLSTVCPACNAPTIRRACKVRCQRCGFMWDCSEL